MDLAETADSGPSGGRDQQAVFALGRATRARCCCCISEGKTRFAVVERLKYAALCPYLPVSHECLGSASPKPGRIRQTSVNLGK